VGVGKPIAIVGVLDWFIPRLLKKKKPWDKRKTMNRNRDAKKSEIYLRVFKNKLEKGPNSKKVHKNQKSNTQPAKTVLPHY